MNPHTLRQRYARDTGSDHFPETTTESWTRPHTNTGRPVVPGEENVERLARWLCRLDGITVTEEDLIGAARAARAARPGRSAPAADEREASDGMGRVRLARGEVYEQIVDATMFLGVDSLLGHPEQQLRDLLNAGQPIPTYYAYLTHRGYVNWVALTEDHLYTYYRASVELCRGTAAEIALEVVHSVGSTYIDYVGLGPGTGSKDRALIESLWSAISPVDGSLFYYPYDINPAMIVHATQSVLRGELHKQVLVKAILAPFKSLKLFSHVYKDRSAPNVLALLGNTLGNMSDDLEYLETLYASGMWRGDILLLEVRCHVDEQAGQAPGIGEERKKRFNFGPMEILGASYDEHRDLITFRRERSRSVIPNTVTTVTVCERVRAAGMTWPDVRLAYVHEYSEPDLDAVLTDIGYTILKKYQQGVRGAERVVLFYLLQKD